MAVSALSGSFGPEYPEAGLNGRFAAEPPDAVVNVVAGARVPKTPFAGFGNTALTR